MNIQQLLKNTSFKRGDLYNVIARLEKVGLIEVNEKENKKIYFPVHPDKLEEIMQETEKEIKNVKNSLNQAIPELISLFNMSANKPGVRFLEGKEGIVKAFEDTFTSQEPIYTYTNGEAVDKYIKEINEKYSNIRNKKGVDKKVLLIDNKYNRDRIRNFPYTNYRFLPANIKPFNNTLQIYDNKVSYISLRPENLLAVIIYDKDIYQMHRSMFEMNWEMCAEEKTVAKPDEESTSTVFN